VLGVGGIPRPMESQFRMGKPRRLSAASLVSSKNVCDRCGSLIWLSVPVLLDGCSVAIILQFVTDDRQLAVDQIVHFLGFDLKCSNLMTFHSNPGSASCAKVPARCILTKRYCVNQNAKDHMPALAEILRNSSERRVCCWAVLSLSRRPALLEAGEHTAEPRVLQEGWTYRSP
jgi:hypothetical protein